MAKIREPEDVVLNLIPIMNLFTALIPFLLLSAAFFHLSVIQVTTPTVSNSPQTPTASDEVTLQLHITPRSFELAPASASLAGAEVEKHRQSIPRVDREAPRDDLTEAAHRLKRSFTASDTVIVTADAEIPFEEVVAAMDAVRETTVVHGRIKSRIALFPRVVLSSRK